MFVVPFVFGLIIPNTYTNIVCGICKRRQAQKVAAIIDESGATKPKKKKTVTEALSLVLVYFINLVALVVIIGFLYGTLIVHGFQYKLLDGELINSGGLNEIFSVLFLVIISIMHYQREVTQDDIQVKMEKFEEALSRRSMKSMKTA